MNLNVNIKTTFLSLLSVVVMTLLLGCPDADSTGSTDSNGNGGGGGNEKKAFAFTWNGKEYGFELNDLDVKADENKNIVSIFIDENYDATKPLNLKVTPTLPTGWTTTLDPATEYNFSDQEADIFDISDGTTTGKFRLHIIRRPILVDTKPAGNVEKSPAEDDSGNDIVIELEDEYEASGANAVSIRKFVQTDYYYVPTVVDGEVTTTVDGEEKTEIQKVPTNLPAPTFALFGKDAALTADNILTSPVRVLRNFTTDDGNTLFFSSVDDGIEDDEWDDKHHPQGTSLHLNPVADLMFSLSPSTDYSLHWAMDASNGKFSGSLRTVSTSALPTSVPTTGTAGEIKYFGVGGMKAHPVEGLDFRVPVLVVSADALGGKDLTQWTGGRDDQGKAFDIVTGGFNDVEGIMPFYNVYDPVSGINAAYYGIVATHNGALTYVFGESGIRTEYGFIARSKIIEIE